MSEQALTSLAVLTVNWNRGRDHIDSFVPLVAECLRKAGDGPVSAIDLQATIKSDFRLKIPVGALQVILKRCARDRLVERKNNVYFPNRKRLDAHNFGAVRAEALRQHQCLIEKLQAFAKERYGLDWSEENADEALLGYLKEGSLPVLVAATEGDPLPKPHRQSRKTRHVLSAFAGHLCEADPKGFECLETVVKGHILSSVLFYPDLGQVQAHFEQLDIYCDTPFLLRAIGYSEEGLNIQCVELVELLRDLGANLKCFHHTREEVAGVLETGATQMRVGKDPNGESIDYHTSKSFRLTDIEELIFKLEDSFGKLNIEVVDTPTWTMEPDEAALDEAIRRMITYRSDKTREKDMKSLAAIHRLRSGRRMEKLESAKAIFVTTNVSLARASAAFFRNTEGQGGIPICIPVELMTRLAWVKKPMAKPDLPRHMVIASSYAALNPSEPLWREYLAEITHRREIGEISDDEYHFLRSSHEAREALMDETYGDEHAFSAGTVGEVLAHAKATIQAEADARTDAEHDKRLAAEKEAKSERERRESIERVHRERVEAHGRVVGSAAGWAVVGIVGLAFVVGVIADTSVFSAFAVQSGGWRVVLLACLVVSVVVSIVVVFKGLTLPTIRKWVSCRVERAWCKRRLHKLDELHSRGTSRS